MERQWWVGRSGPAGGQRVGDRGILLNVGEVEADHSAVDWRELVAVILLSVTTVLTAWSGFQATKWAGVMAISFNQASATRIEATRQEGAADRKQAIQVSLYAQWVQARASRDQALMDYVSVRFPEPLKTAFDAWVATNPDTNPQAPSSPFAMPEYSLPELAAADAADQRAEDLVAAALQANQRGDNYTLLTVAFASVLFFAAMAGRMRSRGRQLILLDSALALFAMGALLLLVFPKRF